MKRTFIATRIEPSTELLNAYTKLRNELENEKIKWVDPEIFHLTLFFIGDTEEESIAEIGNELSNLVDQLEKTTIRLQGLGVFKNIHKPRVLWAGIEDFEGLRRIKTLLDKTLLQLGFVPDNREFKPHLTLARIKWLDDKNKLNELLDIYRGQFFQVASISEIVYYESILKPSGPVYKPIERFVLP